MANGREGRSGAEPGDPPNPEEEGKQRGWRAGGRLPGPASAPGESAPSPNAPPQPLLFFHWLTRQEAQRPRFSPRHSPRVSPAAGGEGSAPEIARRPQQILAHRQPVPRFLKNPILFSPVACLPPNMPQLS
ncbi:uncharacterized protein PHA67_011598 [Liasis olivaceus]